MGNFPDIHKNRFRLDSLHRIDEVLRSLFWHQIFERFLVVLNSFFSDIAAHIECIVAMAARTAGHFVRGKLQRHPENKRLSCNFTKPNLHDYVWCQSWTCFSSILTSTTLFPIPFAHLIMLKLRIPMITYLNRSIRAVIFSTASFLRMMTCPTDKAFSWIDCERKDGWWAV